MIEPTIAVCIVFYNKAELTCRCIASAAKSQVPVYALDNGSEATSAAAVQDFCRNMPNVTYLTAPKNLGPAGGRNNLIDASTEDWLLFLDNDITVETADWQVKLRAHITSFPAADAISLSIINSWDGSVVRPARLQVIKGAAHFTTVEDGQSNLYPGGGTAVRRTLFQRLGSYDPNLWAFEEAELALRAITQQRPINVRMTEDIKLLHHHDFVKNEIDRQAVRERYDTSRIGLAQQQIEQRYGLIFERNYARWVRAQTRDHLVPPWLRNIERGIWQRLSRIKRFVLSLFS